MTDLLCSTQTAALGESMAGTANGATRWVLAEVALPWSKPIKAHTEIANLDFGVLDRNDARFLAIADTTSELSPNARRVLVYERPASPGIDPNSGTAGRFTGSEAIVGADELPRAIEAAAAGKLDVAPIAPTTQDVLVCTQGTHDRCCGRFGTLLHTQLLALEVEGVRLWRCSHLGGHRFAPTTLTFPDGLCWGGVDLEFAYGLMSRTIPGTVAATRLRGSAAINDKAAQLADVAAASMAGWDWLDSDRTWQRDELNVALRSDRDSFDIALAEGDTFPVPPCGLPLEQAVKSTKKLDVVAINQHDR